MPLPAWLRRWAAGVLEFIEAEAKALPALLLRKGRGRKGFGASSDVVDLSGEEDEEDKGEGEHGGRNDGQLAQAAAAAAAAGGAAPVSEEATEVVAEVEHQRKARIQALACAIDKAKLLLRHQASARRAVAGVWGSRVAGSVPAAPASFHTDSCCAASAVPITSTEGAGLMLCVPQAVSSQGGRTDTRIARFRTGERKVACAAAAPAVGARGG